MSVCERTGNLAGGVVCLLIAAFYLYVDFANLLIWTPGRQPGAGFFPTLLGSALVLLSCLLIARALLSPAGQAVGHSSLDRGSVARPFLVLVAVAAWIFLFPILGYVLSTWLLTGGLMWFFGPAGSPSRKLGMAALISGLGVGGFYLVFGVLFELELPAWPSIG